MTGLAKAIVVLLAGLTGAAWAQMSTPGSFRVSESGAAVYEIPIKVPPGVAGMEPKLSLVYHSQSGNGLLGVGWSLQGLSAITRCPRTMAQDGVRGGVNYDTNDRYCLDGQRLMAVSGSYGADGAEYRTERESFNKVISYGTAGNGPSYFKAWTKSGQIIEYGNTADSKIEAQGKTTVRVWAVNKIQDTKSNYLTITYTEDSANGDYYPNRIDYTGNAYASLAPVQSVRFTVQPRTDITPLYQGGSIVNAQQRMTTVISYSGEQRVKEYRLNYSLGLTGRSVLNSVTECANDGTCLPNITLTWSGGSDGFEYGFEGPAWSDAGGWSGTGYYSTIQYPDLNGDGLPDICGRHGGGIQCWFNTGSGFVYGFDSPAWSDAGGWGSAQYYSTIRFLDINGDGKADLCGRHGGGIQCYYSTGTGFVYGFEGPAWGDAGGWSGEGYYSTIQYPDINGDGLPDICGRHGGGIQCWFNTGSGFVYGFDSPAWSDAGGWGSAQYYSTIRFLDINGDGKADLCGRHGGGIQCYYSTGTGFVYGFEGPAWSDAGGWSGPGYYSTIQYPDLNGDGLPDICGRHGGGIQCWFNTGSGFVYGFDGPAWSDAGGWGSAQYYSTIRFLDINGDGKADLCGRHGGGIQCYYSTGTGFVYGFEGPAWSDAGGWSGVANYSTIQFVDVSADSQTDLCGRHGGGIQCYRTAGGGAERILTIASGAGMQLVLTYQPLTHGNFYTKDIDAIFPVMDLRLPLHVVFSASSTNGIGGTVSTNFRYTGLKAELGTGRGLLGFKQVESTEVSTGVKSLTLYRQDWPYVGLPSQAKRIAPDGTTILSQSDATYACLNPATGSGCTVSAGNRYFPYVSQSDETNRDLNNTFLSKVRTQSTYDLLGNATQISVMHLDAGGGSLGYGKTTTNNYTNDTTNWLLGRLIRSEVQSTIP